MSLSILNFQAKFNDRDRACEAILKLSWGCTELPRSVRSAFIVMSMEKC